MPARQRNHFLFIITLFMLPLPVGLAQSSPSQVRPVKTFTLEDAIRHAETNYPAIRAAREQIAAAQAGVTLARTNYLPSANSVWQSNRATANNIFGLLLPQSVVPSISGPVLPATSNRSVWGSAAGLLFSWEPADFGLRRAKVDSARATENRAAADDAVTHLEVAVAATDAFLTLLAARQTVHAVQADVERREILGKSVHVLVDNQLRPGADASRADADLALARTNLIRAQQQERINRVVFAQTLGLAGTEVDIQPGPLLDSPPEPTPAAAPLSSHPIAAAEEARINEALAREHILSRTDYPRFYFQSALTGRGSGANPNGTLAGGVNGLGLERKNWAAGVTIMFPNLFDFASLRAQKHIEAANERAEVARYDQTMQNLTGQREQAQAALEGARAVAENTPIELHAARDSETQAAARYKAGLANMVEVADAQSLLAQAEIDDALARLAVWHNLAALAASQGSLEPFLEAVRQRSTGGH